MRRRSSGEQLDIDDEQSQTTLNPVDYGSDSALPDSTANPCYAVDDYAVHQWTEPLRDSSTDNDITLETSSVEPTTSMRYTPWDSSACDAMDSAPTSCLSVRMSILHELCSADHQNTAQDLTMSSLMWRRYPASSDWGTVEMEEDSMMVASGRKSPACSSDPGVGLVEEETADPGDHVEREHEERRILERFASFPSGRSTASPRSGRWRNSKRKGAESPRQIPFLSNLPQIPAEAEDCTNRNGQRQLHFDLTQLHDHGSSHEPVISHGMRPARGWASFDIQPDEEDDVTVSPRALSPEMDEPAGSLHVQRFAGREPQERRTTFLALGGLRHSSSGGIRTDPLSMHHQASVQTNEHPAAHRAKQLIQQIGSLKERVKLYEDAFETRYGYRPSHHQKMDDRNTKRILTELARARKELKQLKERYHLSEVEAFESCDANSGEQNNRNTVGSYATSPVPGANSVEQTVVEIQEHLAHNRQLAGRPEAVEELSSQEVLDEKLAVQRALLYVESMHGRPASYRHKDLLRPLYDRYRLLKRMVVRSGLSRSKEEIGVDLAPILEHETLELSHTRPASWHRHSAPATPSLESMEDAESSFSNRRLITTPITRSDLRLRDAGSRSWTGNDAETDKDLISWKRQKISLNIEENLHALPLNQLVEQMRHVREEKRRLRRTIRETEADLLRKGTGGSVTGGYSISTAMKNDDDEDDDVNLEPIYAQYRHARAKLRLLEALVAKHDGSATL